MEKLYFRMAARCEAAGRPNNEDNYQLDADLSVGNWQFQGDQVQLLSDLGALLLVCDGMGGMNAGEVASDIAVKTVKHRFSSESLSNSALNGDEQRIDFISRVIQEADANIKKESSADEAKRGMGSTIVLAWMVEGKVYVGWCGDSRAYKYNPNRGLVQLSHDHSYVQELVDSGKLSAELAFDHPNSNIITRSLGDPRGTAQPDVKCYPLQEDDIILLCSDGLCGVLRDHEIEQLIASHQNSMVACRDALWEGARNAGWHDNVTIALAQVLPQQAKPQDKPSDIQKPVEQPVKKPKEKSILKNKKYLKIGLAVLAVLLVLLALFFVVKYLKNKDPKQGGEQPSATEICEQLDKNGSLKLFNETNSFKELMSNPSVLDSILDLTDDIKRCDQLKGKVEKTTNILIHEIEEENAQLDAERILKKLEQINTNLNK